MNYDFQDTPIRILDELILNYLGELFLRTNYNLFQSDSIQNQNVELEFKNNRFDGPSTNCINHITMPQGFLDFSWCSIAYFWSIQEISNQAQIDNPNAEEVNILSYHITSRSIQLGPMVDKIIASKKEYELYKEQNRLDDYERNVPCMNFTWDNDCIHPAYQTNETDIPIFIIKTNGIYSQAMLFSLLHEFGHIFHQHTFINGIGNIEQEKEADAYAIRKLLDSSIPIFNNPLQSGLAAMSSFLVQLLFLDPDYKAYTVRQHPPLHERIRNIIEILEQYHIELSDINYLYNFSTQIFSLFLKKKGEQNLFNGIVYDERAKFFEILEKVDNYIFIDFSDNQN